MVLSVGSLGAGIIIGVLLAALLFSPHMLNLYGGVGVSLGIDQPPFTIHATVTFYKDGELYAQYYHAGVLTDLGDNMTMAKLSGDSWYNLTWWTLNMTYISIGNDTGTLGASSTVLPNEWNRTLGTVEDQTANSFNLTATFYPTGSQTADCIGINTESGIGNDNTLWGYDTFGEVTGIDDTFTVNVEFKVSVTYS